METQLSSEALTKLIYDTAAQPDALKAEDRAAKMALLERLIITDETDVPPVQYLCEVNGRGVMPRGEAMLFKGSKKNGKSMLSTIAAGTALGLNILPEVKPLTGRVKVLHIDTEQSPRNVKRIRERLRHLAGDLWPELTRNYVTIEAESAREAGLHPRDVVEMLTADKQFDIIILDGAKDFLRGRNINDPEDATETAQYIRGLARRLKCWVVAVLHTNPGDNEIDAKGRGHLGTELQNECSETWHVSKKESPDGEAPAIFTAKNVESRDHDTGNAYSLSWSIKDGYFVSTLSPAQLQAIDTRKELKEELVEVYGPAVTLSRAEIEKRYKAAGIESSLTTIKRKLKEAESMEILKKSGRGEYSLIDR